MGRPLRIEYENAIYHVMVRGIRKEAIFYCDGDRLFFLERLEESATKYGIIIHSYVLMPNHYHILLETPWANLSQAMHFLNSGYVNWFISKHEIVGPLLQGRFKAKLIERESYFCNASAYIHLNPLRASLIKIGEEYPWSSYEYLIGKRESPWWLSDEIIITEFSGDVNQYQSFVIDNYLRGEDQLYEFLFEDKGLLIGGEAFKERIKSIAAAKISEEAKNEIPQYNILVRRSIDEILSIVLKALRITEDVEYRFIKNNIYKKILIYALCRYTDAKHKTIGKIFSLHYSTISHIAKKVMDIAKTDLDVANKLELIDKLIFQGGARSCVSNNLD